MEIYSLRSGSRGNAALIITKNTKILVDCGISKKMIAETLNEMGISPCDIDGVVISHEHSDHTKGLGVFMRGYNIPVWATEGTWNAMKPLLGAIDESQIKVHDGSSKFEIKDVEITPFSIPHDASEPVGYTFFDGKEKAATATDIGELKADLFAAVKGSKSVLLEANHDVNMLEMGRYPYPLKRRIRGAFGHLSNDEAGKAAEFLIKLGTERILLGHLSEENNYPGLAFRTVEGSLKEAGIEVGRDVKLGVASQYEMRKV